MILAGDGHAAEGGSHRWAFLGRGPSGAKGQTPFERGCLRFLDNLAGLARPAFFWPAIRPLPRWNTATPTGE
ncbi:MAG: hypothetical protein WAS21_03930 [Geminicoccaceae bacterium]